MEKRILTMTGRDYRISLDHCMRGAIREMKDANDDIRSMKKDPNFKNSTKDRQDLALQLNEIVALAKGCARKLNIEINQ